MDSTLIIAAILLIVMSVAMASFIYKFWYERRARITIEQRFEGIIDLDKEMRRLQTQAEEARSEIEGLRSSYREKRLIYDRLQKEVAICDEKLAFAEMGVYEPHFDFTDSEQYKAAIEKVREEQKRLMSNNMAVICTRNWSVDGSAA